MNELKKQTGNLFEADREERITVELQGLCWSDINIIVYVPMQMSAANVKHSPLLNTQEKELTPYVKMNTKLVSFPGFYFFSLPHFSMSSQSSNTEIFMVIECGFKDSKGEKF